MFADVHSYDLRDILNSGEIERISELGQGMGNRYKLHLGVFDKDNKFIGWSWGIQESASTFYMVSSAILKDHRRKGLYGALLGRCITVLSKKGFQIIYSRHCSTNNDVIIPKLKAGFIISKMEIDDIYGVLIHLHFYTNSIRRKIMDYRSGRLKPDTKINEVFKMFDE